MGAEGGTKGWKLSGLSAEQYTALLVAYAQEIGKDPYVLGAVVFSSGVTTDWENYDVDPITSDLIKQLGYGGNHVSIDVGVGFKKCIPLIGDFTESEIYHDQGKPTQTSLALAQNGYATYRDLTNDTFAHHNNGAVWSDFGNHGDGSMRQIRGPF